MAAARRPASRPRRSGGPGAQSRARAATRRPAAARRTTPTSAPKRRKRTGFTSRATVLGLLLISMTLLLTVPLRQYLAQHSRVTRLQAQLIAQEREVAALEEQRRRLNDPAYVERLARERLHFVRPGETSYLLLDPTPSPGPLTQPGRVKPTGADLPWYEQVWRTVRAADKPAPSPKPSPAKK